MSRDWTLTDQADAEDARQEREWWRRDPYAEPDFRAAFPDLIEELTDRAPTASTSPKEKTQ